MAYPLELEMPVVAQQVCEHDQTGLGEVVGIAPVRPTEKLPGPLAEKRTAPPVVFPCVVYQPVEQKRIVDVAFGFAEATPFRLALALPNLPEELVGRRPPTKTRAVLSPRP